MQTLSLTRRGSETVFREPSSQKPLSKINYIRKKKQERLITKAMIQNKYNKFNKHKTYK